MRVHIRVYIKLKPACSTCTTSGHQLKIATRDFSKMARRNTYF